MRKIYINHQRDDSTDSGHHSKCLKFSRMQAGFLIAAFALIQHTHRDLSIDFAVKVYNNGIYIMRFRSQSGIQAFADSP